MEHAIGSIVNLPDGRKAEVVESPCFCSGCVFLPVTAEECFEYECLRKYRSDHKNIIYKEIKDN